MPSSGPRTYTNRILRDYLITALRCASQPLTTTQLRQGAPPVVVPGRARPLPPTQEAIYRLLRSLQGEGAIQAADATACRRTWMATANPVVEHEIASLDALFGAPSASVADRLSKCDPCRRRP